MHSGEQSVFSMATMSSDDAKPTELDGSNRKALFAMLMGHTQDGALKFGSRSLVATKFKVAPSTVGRIYDSIMANIEFFLSEEEDFDGIVNLDKHEIDWRQLPDEVFETNRGACCGRKLLHNREALKQRSRLVPLNKKKTYRSLAKQLGVSHQLVFRLLRKEQVFRRHVSGLKPTLTDANKWWRLEWAVDKIDPLSTKKTHSTRSTPKLVHRNLMNEAHLDEKWFFLCEEGARCILVSDEKDPVRTVKHKSHISKVLFMCCQARPRWLTDERRWWDGKLGMWPIGEWTVAQRSSANGPAGTPEWQNTSVTGEVHLQILLEKTVPPRAAVCALPGGSSQCWRTHCHGGRCAQ